MRLHIELWLPELPKSVSGEDRGNSGIYLQGRYEIQVLDCFGRALNNNKDCASVYGVKAPDVNASTAPQTWQTYDIEFRQPRWSGMTKQENARVSVTWNGQLVHSDVEIPGPTQLGDAETPDPKGIRLQDHDNAVRYRNIYVCAD